MEQKKALAILKSGRNVFLTGSAGAGKTYVLNQYIAHLKANDIPVAVTASTGIAATHINGLTIHSWSGIGVMEQLTARDLKKLAGKRRIKNNIKKAAVLIIDEVSMLHRRQLDMVEVVCRTLRESSDPFGGLQVIFCGDFFQLPPVGNPGERSSDKMAFMSQSWQMARPQVCYLTTQYRQKDQLLTRILNDLRNGTLEEEELAQLQAPGWNERTASLATRLYTHNVDVDRINRNHLDAISAPQKTFHAKLKGPEKILGALMNSVLTEENLPLKTGARVMFIKNNFDKGYMNGTLGEVVEFSEDNGYPMVVTLDGDLIEATPEKWSMDDEAGKTLASFEQVPLRLAWAITVHKSQGMTLDAAEMDLERTFEPGQGYVALSRVRDASGLHLLGYNSMTTEIDSLVRRADARFRELAEEADTQLTIPHLEQEEKNFWKNKKREHLKKLGSSRVVKKDETYKQTHALIKQGKSLGEIAQERELTESTIIQHLHRVQKLFPSTDISRFQPDEKTMAAVRKAYAAEKQEQNGKADTSGLISLKSLHAKLNGEVSYNDLKLALVFVDKD